MALCGFCGHEKTNTQRSVGTPLRLVYQIGVVALSLCHIDRHLAAFQPLAGHIERGDAGRRGRFDDDDTLAMEGTHCGRGEDLGRGGVAVAARVELGR